MIHILRVYWRYYWGRLLGRDMRLWGKPGTLRFKVVWFKNGRKWQIFGRKGEW